MTQRLTREEAIAAFDGLRAELDEIRGAENHKGDIYIQSSERIQAVADRGSLFIGSIPIMVDLASIWRYPDRGILPEDGGAPIHAFHRRLFHYQSAAKRIVDILSNDVLWRLHGASPHQTAMAAGLGTDAPTRNGHDRQYAGLLDLVQPLLRLVEWSKRYISLLGDDGGVKSRIARSSHLEHFRSAGRELQASWAKHEPAMFDHRVREAFASQRVASLTERLARLTDADRDDWDNTVRAIHEEAGRLDTAVRAAIGDYQRGVHVVSTQGRADPEHEFMAAAIEEARKSRAERNKTPLFVGAVVVKDGKIIARGHRGQHALGEHAEYTTLERNLPARGAAANATLYCTLEPCIVRNPPKSACTEWIRRHRIARVVIGVIDPNRKIRGGGVKLLRQAGIDVALFPKTFANEIEAMNSAFEREHELAETLENDTRPPLRGFTRPTTVPEIFYEWRRWENPTGKLEDAEGVFDRAWAEMDESGERCVWDVVVVNATEIGNFYARASALKEQLAASRASNKVKRYYTVVAVVGDAPGDAERGARTLLNDMASWPTKLGVAILVGWIAKHHFVGEAISHGM